MQAIRPSLQSRFVSVRDGMWYVGEQTLCTDAAAESFAVRLSDLPVRFVIRFGKGPNNGNAATSVVVNQSVGV